jgi:hypothetical protein
VGKYVDFIYSWFSDAVLSSDYIMSDKVISGSSDYIVMGEKVISRSSYYIVMGDKMISK